MSGPKRRAGRDHSTTAGHGVGASAPAEEAQCSRGHGRLLLAISALTIGLVAIISGGAWYALSQRSASPRTVVLDLRSDGVSRPKAVIVDQLSSRLPDRPFVDTSTSRLRDAGYDVDYVAADEVTVDFYRALPARGYRLILLRSHSARRVVENEKTDSATLFTTETASIDDHHDELVARRLGFVQYDDGTADRYFGVRPEFIEQDMEGQFDPRTVVVLMGCDGLRSDRLAQAFTRRGAQSFVSWDQPVTETQTDHATSVLIDHLLQPSATLAGAVNDTMLEVGPDAQTGARLAYYPR